MGWRILRLMVNILAKLRLMAREYRLNNFLLKANVFALCLPEIFYQLTFLWSTVKICRFFRLTVNFFVILRLTVNVIETLYWSLFYNLNYIGLKIKKVSNFQKNFIFFPVVS